MRYKPVHAWFSVSQKNSFSRFIRLVFFQWVLWLTIYCTIHATAKVFEGTSRNTPARNTLVQLTALYTNPESHNAQHYRQTDRRTDKRTTGWFQQSIIQCSSTIG